jgi:hypothetical protein
MQKCKISKFKKVAEQNFANITFEIPRIFNFSENSTTYSFKIMFIESCRETNSHKNTGQYCDWLNMKKKAGRISHFKRKSLFFSSFFIYDLINKVNLKFYHLFKTSYENDVHNEIYSCE